MRKQEHRYQIYVMKKGFKIVPREEYRPPVYCNLNKYGFWKVRFADKDRVSDIPLYCFYFLLDEIIKYLYQSWIPTEKKSGTNNAQDNAITNYCKKTTRKSIAKVVKKAWQEKKAELDPVIEELHRKLYSVSNGTGYWERLEAILKERKEYKYLIEDLLKYPAARISFLHNHRMSFRDCNKKLICHKEWMLAYCYNEIEIYTSLRKTLMNLPGRITYYRLFNLVNVRLPEPATNRLRLWTYCHIGRQAILSQEERDRFCRVVEKTSDKNIKKSIEYIWYYFPDFYTGDFRKSSGIEHALQIIFDYPPEEVGDWDMLGLAKRAEQWHYDTQARENEDRRRRSAQAQRIKEKREKRERELRGALTALPPIPLPSTENIKFLDSYISIVNEGSLMNHCIARYAEGAVKGRAYLFHVDYNGEMASVEVNPLGYVNQSYGPYDRTNNASNYGRKMLEEWAKELRDKSKPPVVRFKEGEEKEDKFLEFQNQMLNGRQAVDDDVYTF